MSEKRVGGEPGDMVELADKETGFTDPDTHFDISRDERVELGERVGERTQQAIMSGGLLIVGSSKAKAKADAEEKVDADAEAKAKAHAKADTEKK